MLLSTQRIFKGGFQNFRRQSNLSFATCLILVMAVSLISFVFLSHKILNFAVNEIKNKADVSVYFQQECEEQEIFDLKEKLDEFETIDEVEYISKEQALEGFIERHKNEQDIMGSLQELGSNPFLASLNIRAEDTSSYQEVTQFLQGNEFENIVEKVDYYKRKPVIENVFKLTGFLDKIGILVSLILILVALLIVYNTIRLTVYSRKKEIGIARLVGASNWLVRGPFLVQGGICGGLAFILSLIIVGFSFYFLNSKISVFFTGFEIFGFFRNNFAALLLIQMFCSLSLGIIPSFIAIRKYLEI